MEEGDAGLVGADARLGVDKFKTCRVHLGERGIDVWDLVADVVQPRSAPVEETLYGASRCCRAQKLEPHIRKLYEQHLDLLRLHQLSTGNGTASERHECGGSIVE